MIDRETYPIISSVLLTEIITSPFVTDILMKNVNLLRSLPNFALHPLIHTLLEFDLSQNMLVCQRDLLSE